MADVCGALTGAPAVLTIISSEWFYDKVIRHSEHSLAGSYRPMVITNKETTARVWVRPAGGRSSASGDVP